MEPVTERPPCPRCGSTRLIGRRERLRRPVFRLGVPWGLVWRYGVRRRKGDGALLCYTYHCEVCGHQWRIYKPEQRTEHPARTG